MSFNLEEFESVPDSPTDQRVDSLLENLDSGDSQVEDEKLDEDVELRLEVASLYRLLLRGDLFADTSNSQAAAMVERHVRAFVKSQLKILLGIGSAQAAAPVAEVKSQFSDDEVTALKAVAAKITGKPAILTQPAKAQPSLKKTEVPKEARVEPRKLAPVDNRAAKPQPKAGKPEAPKKKPGRVIKEYVNDRGEVVERMDATPQVQVPGMIPMPSPQHMAAIQEQQAIASVAGLGGLASLITASQMNNKE